jgi:hypothetical protein
VDIVAKTASAKMDVEEMAPVVVVVSHEIRIKGETLAIVSVSKVCGGEVRV